MPRRTVLTSFVCAALLLGGPSATRADEERPGERPGDGPATSADVRAELAWEGRAVAPRRARAVGLSEVPPDGVLPPAGARAPRYGSVALPGGGRLLFAADAAVGQERVWTDRDLDGQLDDESPVPWSRRGIRSTVNVTVRAPGGGSEAKSPSVPVGVELSRAPFRRALAVRARVGCQRWGAVTLGGTLRQVALEDADGDLRFDGAADRVFVDVNGDGAFDTGLWSPEAVAPGELVRLGSLSYTAVVDGPDGAALCFRAPSTPKPDVTEPEEGAADPAARRPARSDDLDLLTRSVEDPATGAIEERASLLAHVGELGTPESEQYLVRLVRSDRDARLRAAAIVALACRDYAGRQQLFIGVLSEHPVAARAAARELMKLGTAEARTAIVVHVRKLPSAGGRMAVYEGAREAPGRLPDQALLAAAGDTFGPLRALGLSDLNRARDPRVRALALRAAADPGHSDVVRALPEILAAQSDPECVDAMFMIAHEPGGRDPVLDALIALRDGPGLSRVMARLTDEHAEIRMLAAEALGSVTSPRASSALLEALGRERKPSVRHALLTALGERGEARTVDTLEQLANAAARTTRAFAFEALGAPGLRGYSHSFLDRALHGTLRGNRVLAAGAVVSSGDVALLPRVRQALGDEYRLTRLAAAEALGKLRHRDSVRPLIDRLAKETNPRLRNAVAQSLFRLTGVNLYDDFALWERWWSEQGQVFAMPAVAPVLPDADRGKTRGAAPPRFYGIPIESDGVVFVIDQSGSMGGGPPLLGPGGLRSGPAKFDVAVTELLRAVEGLHAGAGVNVVLFESTVRPWARSLQPLTPRVREVLAAHLKSQQPAGETNLFDALRKALLMDDVETIVLLSDGAPTAGRYTEEGAILSAVEQLNAKREVVIHCVSVGVSSSLLRRLAAQNGGRYARR